VAPLLCRTDSFPLSSLRRQAPSCGAQSGLLFFRTGKARRKIVYEIVYDILFDIGYP
jgi:hypothetical protein